METVAIIISLLGTSAMIAYLGSQFKSGSEGGSKYAAVMKVLFNSISFVTLLLVPVAGLTISDSINVDGLSTVMSVSLIPVVFLFIVFVFYLLWQYLTDIIHMLTQRNTEFDSNEFG